jgi:hypothetical protein
MAGLDSIIGAGATIPGTGTGAMAGGGSAVGFSSTRMQRPARQLKPGSHASLLVQRQASAPTTQVGAELSQPIRHRAGAETIIASVQVAGTQGPAWSVRMQMAFLPDEAPPYTSTAGRVQPTASYRAIVLISSRVADSTSVPEKTVKSTAKKEI